MITLTDKQFKILKILSHFKADGSWIDFNSGLINILSAKYWEECGFIIIKDPTNQHQKDIDRVFQTRTHNIPFIPSHNCYFFKLSIKSIWLMYLIEEKKIV